MDALSKGADSTDSCGPPVASQYVDWALAQVGGGGRFQLCYTCLLGLAWTYATMLTYVVIFVGRPAAQRLKDCDTGTCILKHVNCSLPRDAWEFVDVADTYVAEFQLVCDQSGFAPLLTTIYFFGYMVGAMLWGPIADAGGRRVAFFSSLFCLQIAAFASSYAPDYWSYAALHCISGFSVAGFGLAAYVWNTEVLGSDCRSIMACVPHIWGTFGQILLSPMASFLPHWRDLSLAVALFGFIFFAYVPFMLESPRWLVAKGRFVEAHEVLCRIGQFNNKAFIELAPFVDNPYSELSADEGSSTHAASPPSALQLLDSRLFGRFSVMCLAWFSVSFAVYGLSLNDLSLPLDIYWANVVNGLSCVPAYILSTFLIEWPFCARRGALAGSFLIGGACLMLSIGRDKALFVQLYYTATSALSLAWAVLYVYASELFPTDIRSTSIGIQSLCARIGAMIAPFVAALGTDNAALPLIIFAVPSIVAGLMVALYLPETLGVKLLGSLDDLQEDSVQE